MPQIDLIDWLTSFTRPGCLWYAKRLTGNDTLANATHQAGPYIPKPFLFRVFPQINRQEQKNPDVWFDLSIASHADHRQVRAVWYNNKFHGSSAKSPRNETRLTNFGGSESALLNPENTGSIAVFIFDTTAESSEGNCHVWVCRNQTEEEIVESWIGAIDPGQHRIWSSEPDGLFLELPQPQRTSCWLEANEIPPAWLKSFPTGAEIIAKALELRPVPKLSPDQRLLRRRDCEFEVFRSVEEAIELPVIRQGFQNLDDFLVRAQTILQRRKSRSGRSLELHIKTIFTEEKLVEGLHFNHQPESDPGQRPDFIFPSEKAYKDPAFPPEKLRMLAVKTTCKDRWRQITREADRISAKHLLTVQEGVSETQFHEMTQAGVQLVVPDGLKSKYPKSVQPRLLSLKGFISDIHKLYQGA